jgi:ABC-2 type transport system permease protein
MFTAHYWSIKLLLAGIMASIVVSLPIAFAGSILFMLKIKIESINILVSIIIIWSIYWDACSKQ